MPTASYPGLPVIGERQALVRTLYSQKKRLQMKRIHINSWQDFEDSLRDEVQQLGRGPRVIARNFTRVTFSPDGDEQDRLQIAINTGADRDAESSFWNAEGFDHEHDRHPSGKLPAEIIYAFTLDLSKTPYVVDRQDLPAGFDITEGLSEHDAILIYDENALKRVSDNEYWFVQAPQQGAILLYTADNS